MKFFSLLYISNTLDSSNSKIKNSAEKTDVYIKNAILLSKSMKFFGYDYTVLTNNSEFINERLNFLGLKNLLNLKNIEFLSDIPIGIKFYSAHYKIDVLRFFSTKDCYCVLLDLDMVVLKKFSENFMLCEKNNTPILYPITEQVISAYGSDRVLCDMNMLSVGSDNIIWMGGEIIGGNKLFYKSLVLEIDAIWDGYINSYTKLHHQGDEMLVSVAIRNLIKDRGHFYDAGKNFDVFRYWIGPIMHKQISFFKVWKHISIIHLPQNKEYIANYSDVNVFEPKKFLDDYKYTVILGAPKRIIGACANFFVKFLAAK